MSNPILSVPVLSASDVLGMIRRGELAYTVAKRNRKSVDLAVSIPGWPCTSIRVPLHLASGL